MSSVATIQIEHRISGALTVYERHTPEVSRLAFRQLITRQAAFQKGALTQGVLRRSDRILPDMEPSEILATLVHEMMHRAPPSLFLD